MSPKNKNYKNFVGRESELKVLRRILAESNSEVRILFILGDGGIGKTKLVERMLVEAGEFGILAPERPVDLSVTEHRSIDGIQWKIVEMIENITNLKGENSPFAEFLKENRSTSEQFHRCLREFCKKTLLVLAFDTFEVLDPVASNWLFSGGNEGLQVPGLLCIVAGRPSKDNLDKYRRSNNKLVEELLISGLTLSETKEFYRQHLLNFKKNDALGDFWKDLSEEINISTPNKTLKSIWRITKGHPLYVEMALNWADLGNKSPQGLTSETFESKMMEYVCENGERGSLNIGSMSASIAVFDTLACMGYVTRRFDDGFLKFLVDTGYIRHDIKKVENNIILENLEKYFFVKTHTGDQGEQVYQLHDEMARLVREYAWNFRDPSKQKRIKLFSSVIKYYDQLIESTEDENLKTNLRIERLYYTFRLDQFTEPFGDDGRRLWLELVDLDDEDLNRLLPAEIKEYKGQYNPATSYEIRSRIAQIEYDAGHITQARGEWEQAYQLGRAEKRTEWIASTLLNLANCEKNASSALKKFQKAKRFCEKYARDYLPRVNYNIGYVYRRLQDVENAIKWYKIAWREFQKNSKDKVLGAQIANDLGYVYSHVGKWVESQQNIDEAQDARKNIVLQLEREVTELEAKFKSAKSKMTRAELQDALLRKRNRMSKANIQLGQSHNTLGEIYRYQEKLGMALVNYRIAFSLFEKGKNERWQAKALYSRGETYRRIAWKQHREGKEKGYEENLASAENDIQKSLLLCETYRIKDERDTANRRMGRVLHDRAIHALERNKRKEARKYLEQARYHFMEGLKYARETGDDLEILSNQTELAFLYDDFVRVIGIGKVPQEYKDSLKDLKQLLDKYRDKPFRLYQFEVFDNEYKLEEAAVAYQAKRYGQALKKYLEGYVGLAADAGYGRTRYKSLFHHLTGQIERLPSKEAEKWCKAFIIAWETPRVVGKRKFRLASEPIFPDMLEWSWEYLDKIYKERA